MCISGGGGKGFLFCLAHRTDNGDIKKFQQMRVLINKSVGVLVLCFIQFIRDYEVDLFNSSITLTLSLFVIVSV